MPYIKMSSAKTKFINYMNSLYYHPLDDISTLRLIYKYSAKNINQKDNLSEEAKSFVDFILSEEGQNIIAEKGFIKATIK